MDKNYIDNIPLTAPGLEITGAGDTTIDTANDFAYKIAGSFYSALSAGTLPTLEGINVDDGFAIAISVFVDGNQNVTYKVSAPVDANTLIDANGFPIVFPLGQIDNQPPTVNGNSTITYGLNPLCLVGYVIISAKGTAFIGDTTALDAPGITTTYIDNFGIIGR